MSPRLTPSLQQLPPQPIHFPALPSTFNINSRKYPPIADPHVGCTGYVPGFPRFSFLMLSRPIISFSLDTRHSVTPLFTCDPLASTGSPAPPHGPSITFSITKAVPTKTVKMRPLSCGVYHLVCYPGIGIHFDVWWLGVDAEYLGSGVSFTCPTLLTCCLVLKSA